MIYTQKAWRRQVSKVIVIACGIQLCPYGAFPALPNLLLEVTSELYTHGFNVLAMRTGWRKDLAIMSI